jgi:hypothetical protein
MTTPNFNQPFRCGLERLNPNSSIENTKWGSELDAICRSPLCDAGGSTRLLWPSVGPISQLVLRTQNHSTTRE